MSRDTDEMRTRGYKKPRDSCKKDRLEKRIGWRECGPQVW